MPKTCQHTGCAYNVWGKGFCKNHQWERTDKKPKPVKVSKPIKPMSKKLSSERAIYRKLRIEFLQKPENLFCAVFPDLRSGQVHHMRGRGKYLNDTSLGWQFPEKGMHGLKRIQNLVRKEDLRKADYI